MVTASPVAPVAVRASSATFTLWMVSEGMVPEASGRTSATTIMRL